MSFDWDLANIAHLARHRITPDDVEELFRREPRQENYDVVDGEDRWTVVGRTKISSNIGHRIHYSRGKYSPHHGLGCGQDKESIARYFEGN